MRVVAGVALVQKGQAVEAIAGGAVGGVEGPAVLAHQPTDHRNIDQRLQPLQLAHDQGPMGPGAGQRDIEMVAPALGGERRLAQPMAALGVFALEAAVFLCVIPLVVPAAIDQLSHERVPPYVVGGTV
ncbi:hypothetical protein HMPREF3150_00264 [Pseudomonas aeruginosa]|nr:hypothetical protein HMPREF3150_00264 [Pseudomonas aeruginosa]